jgi:hypothetical protein
MGGAAGAAMARVVMGGERFATLELQVGFMWRRRRIGGKLAHSGTQELAPDTQELACCLAAHGAPLLNLSWANVREPMAPTRDFLSVERRAI